MAESRKAPTLEVSGLEISVGPYSVVDGVDLDIGKGEIVALVGESGSGKSLTALSLLGLLGGRVAQTGGAIRLNGAALDTADEIAMRKLRGTAVSMIFQEPVASLNPLMSVGAQVAESLVVHGRAGERDAYRQAVAMLADVGIPEPEKRAKQFPSSLSGGMCQRVMIASALIARPDLLVADEPTTALDVTVQAQILQLMRRLRDETGTSILIITHDMGVVASVADRVCVMYGGRIVEQADVETLFAGPRHPYTKLLLTTIPKITDEPKRELFSISGTVPDISAFPQGCRFRTRCPLAADICARTPPLAFPSEGETGRKVACWRHEETGTLI